MDLAANRIASLFTDLQNQSTKDEADRLLQEFLKDQTNAIEILLHILDDSANVRFNPLQKYSSAIQLKNVLKKYYSFSTRDKNFNEKISQKLIKHCLSDPPNLQQQVSFGLSYLLDSLNDDLNIENSEFAFYLKIFIQELNAAASGSAVLGFLLVMQNLTVKYQTESKSDELFTQILTIEAVAGSLVKQLFIEYAGRVSENSTNNDFKILDLIISLIHNLTYFDLIALAEDNIDTFVKNFLQIIKFPSKSGSKNYSNIISLKSRVMDTINFYVQQYSSDIQNQKTEIFNSIMDQLVNNADFELLNDVLVSKYFKYLTLICVDSDMNSILSQTDVLKIICSQISLKNLNLQESTIESFDETPQEYVLSELINLESNSRRKACSDFLKTFSSNFEHLVVPFFVNIFEELVASFYQNKSENWRDFEKALTILYSVCSKGYTRKYGATDCPKNVDINSIILRHVHPKIKDHQNTNPILLTTCLKLICVFRSFFDATNLKSMLQDILACFVSSSPTVVLFAAYTFNKLLLCAKTFVGQGKLSNLDEIAELMPEVLKHLMMTTLSPKNADHNILNENDILVNAIIHIFVIFRSKAIMIIANDFDSIIKTLTAKLLEISENISKPLFYHSLYELLALLIRISWEINSQSITIFEAHLFPMFDVFFSKQLDTSIPYALQLLALLLDLQIGQSNISTSYSTIINPLLEPSLWESNANVHPVVSLLQSIMLAIPDQLDIQFFKSITQIVKRLITTRSLEKQSLNLIFTTILIEKSVFQKLGCDKKQIISMMVDLILSKIKIRKTNSIVSGLCIALACIIYTESVEYCSDLVENIQKGLFMMVLTKLFFPNLKNVSKGIESILTYYSAFKLLDNLRTSNVIEKSIGDDMISCLAGALNYVKVDFSFESNNDNIMNEDDLDIAASVGTMEYNKITFGASLTPLRSHKFDMPSIKSYLLDSTSKMINMPGNQLPLDIQEAMKKFLTNLQ